MKWRLIIKKKKNPQKIVFCCSLLESVTFILSCVLLLFIELQKFCLILHSQVTYHIYHISVMEEVFRFLILVKLPYNNIKIVHCECPGSKISVKYKSINSKM